MRRFVLLSLALFSQAFAYQVCFEGDLAGEILDMVTSISQLESEKQRPPPTLFTLKKRAESDKKSFLQVMHAFGYYDADIAIEYLGDFPETTVRIKFLPGQPYTFSSLSLIEKERQPFYLNLAPFSLKKGYPARSEVVLETQEQILEQFACMGYPLCSVVEREIVVDQESKTVFVTFVMETGPIAYFGPFEIEGLCKVRRGFINRRVSWSQGDLYHPKKVICTEGALQESGLFSIVSVRPADLVDEEGYLPMLIHVEEKCYRHIGAGISYSTDESAGAMAQWSHDNFSGWGDALAFNGEYSEVIKRATLFYGMPDFFGKDQDLLYSAEARREDAPGFIEKELSFLIRISKKVNDRFSYNYGARYERLLSTKSDNDANYNLFSLPIQIRWDTSNRLLNPTRGTTIAYFFTPYKAILNSHIFFLREELFAATYHPLLRSGALLLALSGQLGSIGGQSRFAIPAPKRFYAGSSTGLRGYKYLSVSPLDGRKPIGGRSLFIGSIEPRLRIWEKLYFATFYDFGNVYASTFPNFSKKMLTSAGFGIRYLTPLGPFRLDVGFPLNKRKGIDKTFQIYASLGQTF